MPESFSGYTIVQVSDLHNKEFGKGEKRLLKKIRNVAPDIIVVTGDLVDSNHTNVEIAMKFMNGAVEIAPVYYITGNHELCTEQYGELKEKMETAGVCILDNQGITISNESNQSIELIGLDDGTLNDSSLIDSNLSQIMTNEDKDTFKILLVHQPELFERYCDNNIDLIFAGHAHGGQIRLPFIGGLVAPNQGFFPTYTSGRFDQNRATMYVSRGLGNSIIPVRIFNRPEIVVVRLEH